MLLTTCQGDRKLMILIACSTLGNREEMSRKYPRKPSFGIEGGIGQLAEPCNKSCRQVERIRDSISLLQMRTKSNVDRLILFC